MKQKNSLKSCRVFDSLEAAATVLNVPKVALRKAKAMGCPAFRGGRVRERELQTWLAKHGNDFSGDDLLSLQMQKLREECRKLRLRNDREDGTLVERAKVAAVMQKILGPISTILEQKLTLEYPAAVAGLDVPQARVFGKRMVDELMARFRDFAKEWEI